MSTPQNVIDSDPTAAGGVQATGDPTQDQIPSDPAERATYFENKFKAERETSRDAKREAKRAKEQAEEYKAGNDLWFGKYKEAAAEVSARPANGNGNGNGGTEAKGDPLAAEIAEQIGDIADIVTDPEGTMKLAKTMAAAVRRMVGDRPTKSEQDAAIQAGIQAQLAELTTYGAVQTQFPELADEKSEFAQAVQDEVSRLAKDPDFKNVRRARLIEIAANMVDRQFLASGKRKEDAESDRERRINAQSGGGRTPRKTAPGKQEPDELQKKYMRIAGVTTEEYTEEAHNMTTYKELGQQ